MSYGDWTENSWGQLSSNNGKMIKLVSQRKALVVVVIFNEDANVTKWFTEGSSKEY